MRIFKFLWIQLVIVGCLYGSQTAQSEMGWAPREVPLDRAQQKMWNNSQKAIHEHQKKYPRQSYVTLEEGLPSQDALVQHVFSTPLAFIHSSYELQGPRPTMEDAKFYKEIEQGVILGIFDGHAGDQVAKYANEVFPRHFEKALSQANGHVHQAFERLLHEINGEILSRKLPGGSTAIIAFIDKHTGHIYTATIGDSEANIYRSIKVNSTQQLKSIPLSCVRDWTSKKDAQRAAIAMNQPEVAQEWPACQDSKCLRLYLGEYALNVSRALGDISSMGSREKPGIIHKPKITVNQVHPGDVVVLACDGLKDYVPENEIISIISRNPSNLAQALVKHAVENKLARDNVSVIVLHVTLCE